MHVLYYNQYRYSICDRSLIAGEEDPVGNYGKGVEKVFEEYRKCGIRDLELKLYEDDRHEILNELDRENVYLDVKNWILKHI